MTTFDDICHAYLLSIEKRPRWAHKYALARLMRRFPEHADALMEFAATESLINDSPDDEAMTAEESRAVEEAFVRRGMEIASRLLSERAIVDK